MSMLIRFPEHGTSYVAVMPPPDAMVSPKDQVFVILTHAAAVAENEGADDEVEVHDDGNKTCREDDIIINLSSTPSDDDSKETSPQKAAKVEIDTSYCSDVSDIVSVFTSK